MYAHAFRAKKILWTLSLKGWPSQFHNLVLSNIVVSALTLIKVVYASLQQLVILLKSFDSFFIGRDNYISSELALTKLSTLGSTKGVTHIACSQPASLPAGRNYANLAILYSFFGIFLFVPI